jgi:hypothetical protein
MRIDCIRAENLDVFSAIASVAFENTGRGAIVVDTTSQAMPGAGHSIGYFSRTRSRNWATRTPTVW